MRTRLHHMIAFGALSCALLAGGCAPAEDAPEPSAPESFQVDFATSAGAFTIEFVREWSPVAVDRVWQLVDDGFWDGARIYRVNERYAQFGFSGRPALDSLWIPAGLLDEPTRSSNVRGSVSFARGGPGTRSAIIFINRDDNTDLDEMEWNGVQGFPPIGRVVAGMESVDALHAGYGDAPMAWEDSISAFGNVFIDRMFPDLDSITDVSVVGGGS